jgi:hypothetical protein
MVAVGLAIVLIGVGLTVAARRRRADDPSL